MLSHRFTSRSRSVLTTGATVSAALATAACEGRLVPSRSSSLPGFLAPTTILEATTAAAMTNGDVVFVDPIFLPRVWAMDGQKNWRRLGCEAFLMGEPSHPPP